MRRGWLRSSSTMPREASASCRDSARWGPWPQCRRSQHEYDRGHRHPQSRRSSGVWSRASSHARSSSLFSSRRPSLSPASARDGRGLPRSHRCAWTRQSDDIALPLPCARLLAQMGAFPTGATAAPKLSRPRRARFAQRLTPSRPRGSMRSCGAWRPAAGRSLTSSTPASPGWCWWCCGAVFGRSVARQRNSMRLFWYAWWRTAPLARSVIRCTLSPNEGRPVSLSISQYPRCS